MDNLLNILKENRPFFILKHQNEDKLRVMSGEVVSADTLSDLPFAGSNHANIKNPYVCAIPFAQAKEKGFPVHDEAGLKLSCLKASEDFEIDMASFQPDDIQASFATRPSFHLSDEQYQKVVENVIKNEIGNGAGANFVIPRSGATKIDNMSSELALSIYKKLLQTEYGNYWTFLYFDGNRYLIGATPGLHISSNDGRITMQPLSGTMRKTTMERGGLFKEELRDFLQDTKEQFELFMLLDEDLKIVCSLSDERAHIYGPALKELSNMVHTYYYIEGRGERPFDEILRRSLFSPTVTGSPIDSAFRVIYTHENRDRRFYGAAIALVDKNERGAPSLDSAVMIRTLEIDIHGNLYFYTGSTIVQDSKPEQETKESLAKIENILGALENKPKAQPAPKTPIYSEDIAIVRALQNRNIHLSKFWVWNGSSPSCSAIKDRNVVIINNEDDFCYLMKQAFDEIGLRTRVIPYHQFNPGEWADCLPVVGPGPGNPIDRADPKMKMIGGFVQTYLKEKTPFFAICLGHQILCDSLGLQVVRKKIPYQGTQREIDLFGNKERVGFYNTFTGMLRNPIKNIEVSCHPESGEIYALKGPTFQSFQFHPESVLTENGFSLLRQSMMELFALLPANQRNAHAFSPNRHKTLLCSL